MGLLVSWGLNAASLVLVAWLIPAVHVSGFGAALIAALVLGLFNAVLRPVLILLTLPVTLLTLGLFILVINGFLFWAAAQILEGLEVRSFGWAMIAALVYSVISWAISALLFGQRA
ncbi:MAG TPA: phage holin family protein [Burkholderiaceae bacterium]|nr:phage holin family protein [Burkholderiaceae bacterium]